MSMLYTVHLLLAVPPQPQAKVFIFALIHILYFVRFVYHFARMYLIEKKFLLWHFSEMFTIQKNPTAKIEDLVRLFL